MLATQPIGSQGNFRLAISAELRRAIESAFDAALDRGSTLGLLVAFAPSLESLTVELEAMAAARGRRIAVKAVLASGALAALQTGDGATHDRFAADACRGLGPVDAVILGQFSLARAAAAVRTLTAVPVLTTPDCAVQALRRHFAGESVFRS